MVNSAVGWVGLDASSNHVRRYRFNLRSGRTRAFTLETAAFAREKGKELFMTSYFKLTAVGLVVMALTIGSVTAENMADLSVGKVFVSPENFKPGNEVELKVEVINSDQAASGPCLVMLTYCGKEVMLELAEVEANSRLELKAGLTLCESDEKYTFRIILDMDEKIEESDEKNNVKVVCFVVGEGGEGVEVVEPEPDEMGEKEDDSYYELDDGSSDDYGDEGSGEEYDTY